MYFNQKIYKSFSCTLLALAASLAVHAQSVIINELMAVNKKSIADGFGEHEDWLELYNNGKDAVNIGGMFISDDINNPSKYQIPANKPKWTTIPPKETMILWVDSDDEQGTRHLSFRLDAEGGSIAVYSQDTQLLDVINYPQQFKDISFGREQDASSQMSFFSNPTPDNPNEGGEKLLEDSILPEISIPGGFYNKSISVALSSRHEGQIYYTLDGSDPSYLKGISYVSPISIDSTTIIRARLIREGYFPGHIVTKTYFINETSTIPVISLTTDPVNLWDRSTGIYHKYKKRGWERPANVEYFDRNEEGLFFPAFNNRVVIRIAGKTSRRQPKKSFVIHTKDQYGNPRINYKVFKEKSIESFASLWLRSDATSGRNVPELWVGERFKNELLYEVNNEMGSTVDMQAYQPVLLFLNGEYWGLYNLMERKGADFIKDNHGYDDVDILTGEYERVVKGRSTYYDKLTKFISNNDIKNDSIYEQVGLMMDIPNYMDYWIYEVYSSTHDNRVNIRYWRPKGEGHKWRWISYDQDSWNTYDENSLKRYISIGDVFLLFMLMKNETFKRDWANRMCDYLNTTLKSENVIKLVDEITGRIADELLREKERWQDTMLYMPANSRIEWFVEYAVQRPCHIRNQIMEFYGLEGNEVQIKVDVKNGNGSVKINTILVNEFPWTGYYLENLPIIVTAIPAPGYKFSRWKGKDLPRESKVQILPYDNQELVPVFKKKVPFSDNLRANAKK